MYRRFSTTALRAAIRSSRKPAVRTKTADTTAKASASAGPASVPPPAVTPTAAPAHIQSVPSMFPDADEDAQTQATTSDSANLIVKSIEALETPEDTADWSTSFAGLGSAAFSDRAIDILLAPVVDADVEITPDGLLYLPEIKYRRILNRAFGPGGWGIAPRTKTLVTGKKVTREYGLVCLGRLVSVSRGEMDFFSESGVTTAMEGCKSNALMRCCKDLGIASELWDPAFIRDFKKKNCDQKYFEKKKRFVWKRKDRPWEYPYV